VSDVIAFSAAGYRYLKGVFQYSAGVAAEPGFEIERARFVRLVPLAEGFRAIEGHLTALGRPLTALCACELRSPAPFTEEAFRSFNRTYVGTLERWGLFRHEANPVARSNVCPEIGPPDTPSVYAFSYTVPSRPGQRPSFHIAGSEEVPERDGCARSGARGRPVDPGRLRPSGGRQSVAWGNAGDPGRPGWRSRRGLPPGGSGRRPPPAR